MFCEKCGTKIDDGQLFCPNCGNRLSDPAAPEAPAVPVPPVAPAAPVATPETAAPNTEPIPGTLPNYAAAPAYQPKAPFKGLKLPSCGGLFDKVNEKEGLGQIFYGCTFILLILCFVLSMLRVLSIPQYGTLTLGYAAPFFTNVITILFTLSITFFVLDYLDKYSMKFLLFFIAGAMALVLLIFIIIWADSSFRLSVGGWFFLIFQLALTAVSVLLVIENLKKKP